MRELFSTIGNATNGNIEQIFNDLIAMREKLIIQTIKIKNTEQVYDLLSDKKQVSVLYILNVKEVTDDDKKAIIQLGHTHPDYKSGYSHDEKDNIPNTALTILHGRNFPDEMLVFARNFNRRNHQFDLHGYNASKAKEDITKHLFHAFSQFKKQTTFIPGKGLHSQNKAILKPLTLDTLKEIKELTGNEILKSFGVMANNNGCIYVNFNDVVKINATKDLDEIMKNIESGIKNNNSPALDKIFSTLSEYIKKTSVYRIEIGLGKTYPKESLWALEALISTNADFQMIYTNPPYMSGDKIRFVASNTKPLSDKYLKRFFSGSIRHFQEPEKKSNSNLNDVEPITSQVQSLSLNDSKSTKIQSAPNPVGVKEAKHHPVKQRRNQNKKK